MSASQIPNPVDTIDICKVFRVKKEDTIDTIDKMLSKYSEFARGKNIVYKTQLGRGSFGFVFLVKIGAEEYAVKVQNILDSTTFHEMATEVNISNILKEYRRHDSHRIAMPIFDCFYLCDKDFGGCEGVMVHIMEKGEGSIENLLEKKASERTGETGIKTILLRDAMVKMMENIHLMVTQGGIINVDLKPANSVYNFKEMRDTGKVSVCPILIDFGSDFCFNRIEDFINLDKLSNILNGYTKGMRPLMARELTLQDSRVIVSYILQYQYLLKSMMILEQAEMDKVRRYEIMSVVFFQSKTEEELISIKDMLEIFINPKPENMWLSSSMRLILGSKIVDSRNTFHIRRNFYHYIVGRGGRITPPVAFKNICETVEKYYHNCVKSLKIKTKSNFQHIDLEYAKSISEVRSKPFLSRPSRAKSDPMKFPIEEPPSEEHLERVEEALSNSYEMVEEGGQGENLSNSFEMLDEGGPKEKSKSRMLTKAMKLKKKAGL